MSGSMTPPGDAYLRVRYGPAESVVRQSYVVGTTVGVYIDAIDRLTGKVAPITGAALAFVYRLPEQGGYPERDIPAFPVLLAPGQWLAMVPTVMTGTYRHWSALLGAGWLAQTTVHEFDVTGGL